MARSPTDESGLLAWVFDWIKTRSARHEEMGRLSRSDISLMASDLGITEADLVDVLPRAADNTLLMDRMMLARGLDPTEVRRHFASLMRELELTCTRCADTRRCRREMQAGTAALHCHDYCLNAETMDDLLETQEVRLSP